MTRELPAACPECGLSLSEADRKSHLIHAHGYLEIGGSLVPREKGLARLWEQVFRRGDSLSHEQLTRILLVPTADASTPPPYADSLAAELRKRSRELLHERGRDLPRLTECLRENASTWKQLWKLLASKEPTVRQVVRGMLTPIVAEEIARPDAAAWEIRAAIDRLCPLDDADEKRRVGQRFQAYAVPTIALKECLRQLQEEAPVRCPECGTPVSRHGIDAHLRKTHSVYAFREREGTREEVLAAMLTAVCHSEPDYDAWESLETFVREEKGANADVDLAGRIVARLRQVPKTDRLGVLQGLGAVIGEAESGQRLALLFASTSAKPARQLALVVARNIRGPLLPELRDALIPLVGERGIPGEIRLDGAAALLRSLGANDAATKPVLEAFTANAGKARAVERLRQLEGQVGAVPALVALSDLLQEQIRMHCPRCRTQLRRQDMARHLWRAHRLLLYGKTVREPFRLIDDWIEEYLHGGSPDLLARCRILAQRADPAEGLLKANRLFLRHHLAEDEARPMLLDEAIERGQSLCPHCFAFVPPDKERPPSGLNTSHHRISARGYSVELSEGALFSRLDIATPTAKLHSGPEPGNWLTFRGAAFLFAGTPALIAVLLAFLLPRPRFQPGPPVLSALFLSMATYTAIWFAWREKAADLHRLVDHAWTMLVPRLHRNGFSIDDSAFVADLALGSLTLGRREARAFARERLLDALESAVATGAAPVSHLAAVRRLLIADAAAGGADPVRLVVEQVGRCFEGELSPKYADRLLIGWEGELWTPANRARLRVLLCNRAFEAGLEISDLLEASHMAPALGAALDAERPHALAQLRLLWRQRAHRPWDRWGTAVSVFELAEDRGPSSRLLGAIPDLLLADLQVPALILCSRGIAFQDRIFQEEAVPIELRSKPFTDVDGFELVLGTEKFRFALEPLGLVGRVQRWFAYYFHEFRPHVAEVYTWKSPDAVPMLRARDMVRCPECGKGLFPRAGNIGLRRPRKRAPMAPTEEMVRAEERS